MPPVFIAIGVVIGAISIKTVLIGIAVAFVLSTISQALLKKPKAQAISRVGRQATKEVVREPIAPHILIYGRTRVGGPLTFVSNRGSNARLDTLITLAGHPCKEVGDFYVHDELVSRGPNGGILGRYTSNLVLRRGLGNRTGDSSLLTNLTTNQTKWTSAHRQTRRAKMLVEYLYSRDVFPSGVPPVSVIVRGKMLYDPREPHVVITSSSAASPAVFTTSAVHNLSVGDFAWIDSHAGSTPKVDREFQVDTVPSTTTFTLLDIAEDDVNLSVGGTGGTVTRLIWTDNAALCVADYILDKSHGLGQKSKFAQIDWTDTVTSAANICDEDVVLSTSSPTFDFTADAAADECTESSPGDIAAIIRTGEKITFSTTGTLPAGLGGAGPFYAVQAHALKDTAAKFKVATSLANAREATTFVDITSTGSGTHTVTRTHQPRFTLNGVVETDRSPFEILGEILTAMAGRIVRVGEVWKIFAGAYRAPTITIDEDDLDGGIAVTTNIPKTNLFNRVKGVYASRDDFWQPTDFPLIKNATFLTEDQEEIISKDIELPYTDTSSAAQRLAKIDLEQVRQQISVVLPCKITVLRLQTADVVNVTNARFGWSAKPFDIVTWKFAIRGGDSEDEPLRLGVDLFLRETASTVYDWNAGEETLVDPAPDTDLPNMFDPAAPTGLTLASGTAELLATGEGSIISRIRATWTAPADAFVTDGGQIEVQAKKNADTEWITFGRADGNATEFFIAPVDDGVSWDVRVRSINTAGVRSNTFDTVTGHTVIGKTAVPPDVDTFTVVRLADGTRKLEWTLTPLPADVRAGGGYRIRFESGASITYATATPLHEGLLISSPFETNELASGQFTFGIKAIDSSGNESTNSKNFTVTLGDPRLRDVLLQQVEHELPWTGTLTDCFIASENVLEAVFSGTPASDWDSLPSTWDALADTWRGIVTNATPLRYETATIDLGVDVTFTPLVSTESVGTVTAEMRTHTDAEGADVSGEAYIALAQVVSERYIQIRVSIAGTTPVLNTMTTLLDGETVVEDFEDINTATHSSSDFELVAAGHFRLATSPDISAITMAQITAIQNVTVPHTWTLVSKTATVSGNSNPAAEFKIFDDNGVLVNATVDVTLKGPKS